LHSAESFDRIQIRMLRFGFRQHLARLTDVRDDGLIIAAAPPGSYAICVVTTASVIELQLNPNSIVIQSDFYLCNAAGSPTGVFLDVATKYPLRSTELDYHLGDRNGGGLGELAVTRSHHTDPGQCPAQSRIIQRSPRPSPRLRPDDRSQATR
jgi:hypothetical protein